MHGSSGKFTCKKLSLWTWFITPRCLQIRWERSPNFVSKYHQLVHSVPHLSVTVENVCEYTRSRKGYAPWLCKIPPNKPQPYSFQARGLSEHKLNNCKPHGSLRKESCTTCITVYLNGITKILSTARSVVVITSDMTTAFDSVPPWVVK